MEDSEEKHQCDRKSEMVHFLVDGLQGVLSYFNHQILPTYFRWVIVERKENHCPDLDM